MICYSGRYITEDVLVRDPVTEDVLQRYLVKRDEDGAVLARFVMPAGKEHTRYEFIAAGKDAERAQQKRQRTPVRLSLVGGAL